MLETNHLKKFGCLMVLVDEDTSKKIINFGKKLIKDEDLYHEINEDGKDEYGREQSPMHITVRYGFTKDLNELDIRQLLKGHKTFLAELYELDMFTDNPNFDVVKFKAKSPILNQLNEISGIYPCENSYPEYLPHLTLGYVKKGTFPNLKKQVKMIVPIKSVEYSPIAGAKSYFELETPSVNEVIAFPKIDVRIQELEQEWERLDNTGTGSVRQQEISKEIERLKRIKEPRKQLDPNSPEIKDKWLKLKQSLIPEWISHGNAVNRSPDDNLYPTPGGMNDGNPHWDTKASFDVNSSNIAETTNPWNSGAEDWDGIIKGQKNEWFAHIGGNDWDKRQSYTEVIISEDDKPHKMWIKIKTHGLRKANDTNESFKERVRKHSRKITGEWISAAKKLHERELNEAGNEIKKSWKDSFKNSMESIKSNISECGESEIDPVNFTFRK